MAATLPGLSAFGDSTSCTVVISVLDAGVGVWLADVTLEPPVDSLGIGEDFAAEDWEVPSVTGSEDEVDTLLVLPVDPVLSIGLVLPVWVSLAVVTVPVMDSVEPLVCWEDCWVEASLPVDVDGISVGVVEFVLADTPIVVEGFSIVGVASDELFVLAGDPTLIVDPLTATYSDLVLSPGGSVDVLDAGSLV